MNRCLRIAGIAVVISFEHSSAAFAGMPAITLSDLARMRFQTISFFLLLFLLCSWVIKWIWNAARTDFPRMPYLSFRRALGLVAVWGLLFLLILTMISGARELMTPGAWKKEGLTYKLKDDAAPPSAPENDRELQRRAALDRLRAALWTYARHHDGHFPASSSPPEIPDEAWVVPDASRMKYLYMPGLIADQGDSPLAYEPGIFGTNRMVLFSSGKIVFRTSEELESATGKAR